MFFKIFQVGKIAVVPAPEQSLLAEPVDAQAYPNDQKGKPDLPEEVQSPSKPSQGLSAEALATAEREAAGSLEPKESRAQTLSQEDGQTKPVMSPKAGSSRAPALSTGRDMRKIDRATQRVLVAPSGSAQLSPAKMQPAHGESMDMKASTVDDGGQAQQNANCLAKMARKVLELRNENIADIHHHDMSSILQKVDNNLQHLMLKQMDFYTQQQLVYSMRTHFAEKVAAQLAPGDGTNRLLALLPEEAREEVVMELDPAVAAKFRAEIGRSLRNKFEEFLVQSKVLLKY